jgi:hypothetical protein
MTDLASREHRGAADPVGDSLGGALDVNDLDAHASRVDRRHRSNLNGWPELAETVAAVYRQQPRSAVILTRNYGEAGAIDRYGPALGLPPAYSGHNAFGDWGPPPDSDTPAIAVGLPPEDLAELGGCTLAAAIDNNAGIDNDERGASVRVCAGPPRGWSQAWPELRHLG